MKIGIFDSGLGGLVIAKSIFKRLPKYDYVYLGDTKNLPYGNKNQRQIYNFTKQALVYLFGQDCKLVIIACNTSSAKALRKIQREFLPEFYPDRKVLGVIVPTLEAVPGNLKRVGVLATLSAAKSHAYKRELKKLKPAIEVYEQAAPRLATLIEKNALQEGKKSLRLYLGPLQKKQIEALVLGCTHYPILKNEVEKIMGPRVKIISQSDIIPPKLADYLRHHPETASRLSKNGASIFEVTKINKGFQEAAGRLFGKKLTFKVVSL